MDTQKDWEGRVFLSIIEGMDNQPSEDRHEKRRYHRWQHDDWNAEYRQLVPAPEPEDYTELTGWDGTVLKRIPDMTGDYLTWCEDPWKL